MRDHPLKAWVCGYCGKASGRHPICPWCERPKLVGPEPETTQREVREGEIRMTGSPPTPFVFIGFAPALPPEDGR